MATNLTNGNSLEETVVEKASRILCHPPPGEEVVVTGMAGHFPESDDVYQFGENLFKKVDLITEDDRRWKPTNPEVPQRIGKLHDLSAFDAGFFGICSRHSNNMDVYVRMMLERTYEVIVDAGYHPSELAGTKIGVFIATSFSDSENSIFFNKHVVNSSSVTGVIRSMIANHISYFFRFQGPSYIVDSGCSSTLSAVEHAYRNIRLGICDMVIVGGTNLCLHPNVSLTFARAGVLSPDGRCKTFDENSNGYVRSESISALFLQKSKNARRVYAHILHAKLNCDGYKQHGVAHPSSEMQSILMEEVYRECHVNLSDVSFIETHGTGTKVGDLQELNALTKVFDSERSIPLFIGAVKSNAGHAEPAAAMLSIIKVLLGMESGFIPPNINFTRPREDVVALVEGRLKVITEKTTWPNAKGIAGVNSLGIGGANGHLVLRRNEKRNFGNPEDDLPRLVCASGRTKGAVNKIWDDLSNRHLDIEFVNLLNTVFEKPTLNHAFRGYQILSKVGGELKRSVNVQVFGDKKKLAWVFNNVESNWPPNKVDEQFMGFPAFAKTWKTIQNIMAEKFGAAIPKPTQILDTMAFQLCLSSLLKSVGLVPDILVGLGTGELIVAYLEGRLTLDEVFSFPNIVFSEEFRKRLQNLKLNLNDCFQKSQMPLRHKQVSRRNVSGRFSFDEAKELSVRGCDVLVIGKQIENFEHLPLIRGDSQNCALDLLCTLGRFYEKGHNLDLNNLYPKFSWPVGRGTPMISPLIKWDHSREWFVTFHEAQEQVKGGRDVVWIDTKSKKWNFITGHVVDGRVWFPATGFLFLVWETLAKMSGKTTADMKIVFQDVKFLQPIGLTNQDKVQLLISIAKANKAFQITRGDDLIAKGTVHEIFETREELKTFLTLDNPENKKSILNQSEIYRRLQLRGFNHKGEFKALHGVTGKENGLIKWTGNWITFMDNMLQMSVLSDESRNLCVPTSIKQVLIDPTVHPKLLDAGALVPVRAYHDLGIISSGGIQVRSMKVDSVARRKPADPILEAYKFIPNTTTLTLEQSVRVMLQIVLENTRVTKFKTVELAVNSKKLISPRIKQALDDFPLVRAEMVVLSENSLEFPPGINVEDKSLREKGNLHLVVLSSALEKGEVLHDALKSVKDTDGFVLTQETLNFDVLAPPPYGLDVLCVHTTDSKTLVLLRKPNNWNRPTVIEISAADLTWLTSAQDAVKRGEPLIFYSQNRFTDGILGLVNCIRKEPNGGYVSCFFIIDDAPEFDPNHPFYDRQIRKNMAVNVWNAGEWGSYRYLHLNENPMVQCESCYANVMVPGDLTSIRFIEGSHQLDGYNMQMIYVYWSALNFRDVLIATGRIPIDILGTNRPVQERLLGIEFSGRDSTGKRVMGIAKSGAIATHVVTEPLFIWTVPDEWSLEDAATVPGVYLTAIYALLMETNVKRGQSVLIHLGAGGVGQAAINVALHLECNIFVTVGTQEKRDFLRETFPQVKVGNSRNTSFEQMVLSETEGRGVDVVLNSLSEEKLLASANCLARNGIFLEIGKFDLARDNELNLKLFEKGVVFQSVMVDYLLTYKGKLGMKQKLFQYFVELLRKGVVKPLPRTVYKKEDISDAFAFMSTGKHIGKVLVNIREEEQALICSVEHDEVFQGLPRFYCDEERTYIVIGGLGGFGLELVDWLVMRGARTLILSSRTGLKTGYQAMMLRTWQLNGVKISVRTDDVTTKEGCVQLITYANSLGPVKAIFNLALVLKDGPFETQTVASFQIALSPKALATQNLDAISRKMCPKLSYFVVFSSAISGRGNVEQSNYGMANSIVERICERRKADGFPALAIQWGAIADVGIIAELQETTDSEIFVTGLKQQGISSCLQVLDNFLRQEEPVVSSLIVANKSAISAEDNITDKIFNILGVTDAQRINPYVSFAELGMDSIMVSEIKQILQRELELFLSSQQIRALTTAKLQDMVKGGDALQVWLWEEQDEYVFKTLLHPSEAEICSSKEPVIPIGEDNAIKIHILPGLDGTISFMEPLIKQLNANAICMQYGFEKTILDTIEDWAKSILPYADTKSNSFVLLGYSFGCVVATELAFLLEKNGQRGKIVFIDGAPNMLTAIYRKLFGSEGKEFLETNAVCLYLMMHLPTSTVLKYKTEILKCTSFEERIRLCLSFLPQSNRSEKFLYDMSLQCCRKLKAMLSYCPEFPKLKSNVKLIKSKQFSVFDFAKDYGLSNLFENVEEVEEFDEGHLSVLENLEVARSINIFLNNEEHISK